MEEKNDIENIFKQAFEQFEAPVSPSAWAGVKAGVSAAKVAGTSAVGSGFAVFGKAGVAAVIAATLSIGAIQEVAYHASQNETEPVETTSQEYPQKILLEKSHEASSEKTTSGINNNNEDKSNTFPKVVKDAFEKDNKKSGREPALERQVVENDHGRTTKVADKSSAKATPPENKPTVELADGAMNTAKVEAPQQLEAVLNATPQEGSKPLEVRFQVQANKEIHSIEWDFGDGRHRFGEMYEHHTYHNPGSYEVVATITDQDGMTAILMEMVVVKDEILHGQKVSRFELPESGGYVLTPNGDGINDYFSAASAENLQAFQISIFTVGGGKVYESQNADFSWNGKDLSGNNVPAGVYYFQIVALGIDGQRFNDRGSITIR